MNTSTTSSSRRSTAPRHPAGTSIIEMLVTVFILALVLAIVTELFILLLRSNDFYERQAALALGASTMTQRVGDVAREAFGVETSRTISGTLYESGEETVILRLASVDENGAMLPGTFDYVVFTRDPADNTRMLEVTDADAASARTDATKQFGEKVQELLFTYQNADPPNSEDVAFTVTLRDATGATAVTHTLSTYATFRNH